MWNVIDIKTKKVLLRVAYYKQVLNYMGLQVVNGKACSEFDIVIGGLKL